ncbi:nicotinate-nucleotide adenylyltransferase [Cerasicoccus frondis]|uniref:nicotinate-nucleotide adenylyltransferase n=1 Tax=Cerasicoccus frondis TaxID=490090 RepID=UPI002852CDE6|nr:nicotinate-nucleotide adenylyltransferase [Cerasicoccus frondis]
MRIGLFGGSFDPIHHGHLLHAQDAMEQADLDLLAFIPAAQAPLKSSGAPGANAEDRVKMIELAIDSQPGFSVLRDEIDRCGVSYTVDTVRRLKERWPNDELFWILGADQVAQLDQWREIDELLKLAKFLCLKRPGYQPEAPSSIPDSALKWISARQLELSSSEIRERAAHERPLRFFLPRGVVDYINKNQLYRDFRQILYADH